MPWAVEFIDLLSTCTGSPTHFSRPHFLEHLSLILCQNSETLVQPVEAASVDPVSLTLTLTLTLSSLLKAAVGCSANPSVTPIPLMGSKSWEETRPRRQRRLACVPHTYFLSLSSVDAPYNFFSSSSEIYENEVILDCSSRSDWIGADSHAELFI